jgi:hypothetical protein
MRPINWKPKEILFVHWDRCPYSVAVYPCKQCLWSWLDEMFYTDDRANHMCIILTPNCLSNDYWGYCNQQTKCTWTFSIGQYSYTFDPEQSCRQITPFLLKSLLQTFLYASELFLALSNGLNWNFTPIEEHAWCWHLNWFWSIPNPGLWTPQLEIYCNKMNLPRCLLRHISFNHWNYQSSMFSWPWIEINIPTEFVNV